jgi:hypothetical protein
MTNELCDQPLKMILLLLKGARVRDYVVALVSLRKDLSVRDHSGYTIQL